MVPSSMSSGSTLPRPPTGPPSQGSGSSRPPVHAQGHPNMTNAYPPPMQNGVNVNVHRSHGQPQHMNVRHGQHGGGVNVNNVNVNVGHGQPHNNSYAHQSQAMQNNVNVNSDRSLPSAPVNSVGLSGPGPGPGQMQGQVPNQGSLSGPGGGHSHPNNQGNNSLNHHRGSQVQNNHHSHNQVQNNHPHGPGPGVNVNVNGPPGQGPNPPNTGPGPNLHSHGHSSMPNAPAPSPYHRPLHSPPGSRPGPPNQHHNPPSHHPQGPGGPGPNPHPSHHNMPGGPGPGGPGGPGPGSHQHHPHMHHPMHPPQHHPGMPPHPPQYHHHYPHSHPPQLAPPPHMNHGRMGGPGGPGGPGPHPQQQSQNSNVGGGGPGPGGGFRGSSSGSSSVGVGGGPGQSGGGGGSEQKPINGWQSNKDMASRREMIQNIVRLLKRSRKDGEINNVLPQMVKQLEVSLYRSAPSYEHYVDQKTLKSRLQELAKEISREPESDRKSNSNGNGNGHVKKGRSGPGMGPGPGLRGPGPSSHGPGPGQHPPQPRYRPSSGNSMTQSGDGKNIVNLGNVNGNMMGANVNVNVSNGPTIGENRRGGESQESKDRLRKQQQRLLLLHHSSKCDAPDGTCKETQYCREMKRLWSHMAKCEDYNCRIQHCYSSRTILSHYRKCKDQNCQICKPVREFVWKPPRSSSNRQRERDPPPAPQSQPTPHPRPPPLPHNKIGYAQPVSSGMPNQFTPNNQSYTSAPNIRSSSNTATAPSMSLGEMGSRPEQNKTEKTRIIHKQQRLLLLRHASKCTAPEGQCTVTPHCTNMKRLWQHISTCAKKDCDTPHCISSRYVLMHYRKCKDSKCPSCQPVRDAIGNQQEKISVRSPEVPVSSMPHGNKPHINKRPPPTSSAPINGDQSVITSPPEKKKRRMPVEDTTSTLLKSLTVKQIELHIQSLSSVTQLPAKSLKEKCSVVLKVLMNHDDGWVFNAPVDPVNLGIPDYFEKIKKPMDLGTINKRLENGGYREISQFDADVRLTFDNAMLYNEAGTPVHEMAKSLKAAYVEEHKKLFDRLKEEEDERRLNDRACSLCGCEKLQFEPPVFFCSGLNCQSKRIHRNRHFYVGGNNQYNWCTSCYADLDDKPIHMQDLTLKKDELVRKKNDEINEENWVQCDSCDRWVHQICGLFNPRQNTHDDSVKYTCPKCLLKERKETHHPPDTNNPKAEDLPRTKFSEYLENQVMAKLKEKHRELAKEKAETENISHDEAFKIVSGGGKITIRQVTSSDKRLEVRDRMRKRYAHKNYPEEFPYRCKCIVVFQELDGIDVVLFALYVYEHDEKNPAPNTRTVYISYLDSVYYMRPRFLRTFIYHEILISYLDYARKRGFATAHIWACPPLKGDDYIFFAKPEDQKTPKDSRLRQWYIDMLIESQKRNIVGKLTNMYDLYFSPGKLDATRVPYLEGDYFSGEIENFIKEVEEGKTKGSKSKSKSKKKGKITDKTKKMRKGTRSGGLDDDFITGDEGKLVNTTDDPVMKQLGDFIKPMKDSFIVAYLNWDGVQPEHLEVSKEIQEAREQRKGSLMRKPTIEDDSDSKSKRDRKGNPIKIIDDDAEELECEILETRQAFLNLCRKNHYQFDQPRRAKSTSMMVLWHLHNPDAAKIVQMCFGCGKDILNGIRYTCQTCPDFDLCPDCYKNPKTNRGTCTHVLVPKPVEGDSNQNGSGGGGQLTEAERNARRHHIKLHIQLLEHASLCNSPKCTSSNCAKMKQYLQHSAQCKSSHHCKICKRILSLLKYHALSCKNKNCPIPQCDKVKERLRQMRRQQQAMDDRRRQVMNRQYRMGQVQN